MLKESFQFQFQFRYIKGNQFIWREICEFEKKNKSDPISNKINTSGIACQI